jgi:hypothetical protein
MNMSGWETASAPARTFAAVIARLLGATGTLFAKELLPGGRSYPISAVHP